jgi:hypothetical protein
VRARNSTSPSRMSEDFASLLAFCDDTTAQELRKLMESAFKSEYHSFYPFFLGCLPFFLQLFNEFSFFTLNAMNLRHCPRGVQGWKLF